jgi:hypothetical protein
MARIIRDADAADVLIDHESRLATLENNNKNRQVTVRTVSAANIAPNSINTTHIIDGSLTGADLADGTITAAKFAAGAIVAPDDSITGGSAGAGVKIKQETITSANILNRSLTGTDLALDTITSAEIAAGAVGSSELADNAVDTAALQDDAVTADKIADNAVGSAQIAADAVGSSELANSAVDTAALQDGAVTTAKIGDLQVTAGKIANDTITATQIAADAIGTSELAPNAVTATELADSAVDTAAVQDGAVTAIKLATDSVTTIKIVDANVTLAKLAPNSVDAGKIVDGSVGSAELGTDSVTTIKIVDGNVTLAKLAANSVDATKIVDGSVGTGELADGAVTSAKIADGTIVTGDLADNSVTSAKIVAGTIVGGAAGVSDIAADTITAANIAADAVTSSELANNAVITTKIADGNVTLAKLAADSVDSSKIVNASIVGGDIANDTITSTQLAADSVTASELADNAVDTAAIAARAVTGAKVALATITGGPVATGNIAADTITAENLAANSVTSSELADNAVDTAAIADSAVTTAKLNDGSVTSAKIADGTVTGTDIATGTVTGGTLGNIASGTITAANIADNTITGAKFQDNSVTSAKIAQNTVTGGLLGDIAIDTITADNLAANSVGTSEIADNAVTGAKFADNSITGAKFADGAVTTVKIADEAVTAAKVVESLWEIEDPNFRLSPTTWVLSAPFSRVATGGFDNGPHLLHTGATSVGARTVAMNPSISDVGGGEILRVECFMQTDTTGSGGAGTAFAVLRWTNSAGATADIDVNLSGGATGSFALAFAALVVPVNAVRVQVGLGVTGSSTGLRRFDRVKVGQQTSTEFIADRAVSTVKLALDAVDDTILAANAVLTEHIANGQVTLEKLAANAVDTANIAADSITIDKIAANAVGTVEVVDRNITGIKIALGTITSDLFAGSVQVENDARYVNVTGDTMSGTLTVVNALQVGGAAAKGIFDDTTNIAIRTNNVAGAGVYLQSHSGTTTFAQFGPTAIALSLNTSVTGDLSVTGTLSSGAFSPSSIGSTTLSGTSYLVTGTTDGLVQFNGGSADGTTFLYANIGSVQRLRLERQGSARFGGGITIHSDNVLGAATASITKAGAASFAGTLGVTGVSTFGDEIILQPVGTASAGTPSFESNRTWYRSTYWNGSTSVTETAQVWNERTSATAGGFRMRINSGLAVEGDAALLGSATVGGTLNSTGNLSENGNRVYNAANANLASTAPPAISATGAVGTGTLYARDNHTHSGVTSIAVTNNATASAANGAVTITNSLTPTFTTATIGVTTVGATNRLDFANPGIGGSQEFRFLRASDTAGIRVTEPVNDQLKYEFYMSDNPEGGDYFSWFFTDFQGPGAAWQPLYLGGMINEYQARQHTFRGDLTLTDRWYSGVDGRPSTVYRLATGTLTLTPSVSAFTGTTRTYWVKIDGTGTPDTFSWGVGATTNAAVATAVPITGAAQTLDNGTTITFNATTGGVVGDLYQFRAYSGGTLSVGRILDLPRGSAATPPLRLTDSGVWSPGTNQIAFTTGGATRLLASNTGVAVTGTLDSTGNLSENGNRVYSAANANLASATPAAIATSGAPGAGTAYARDNHVHAGVGSAVAGTGIGVSAATGAVTISNAGVLSLTGTANQIGVSAATGAITLTNLGYHAGNANLASATPAAVAAAGSPGAGTAYARDNHVHAGVTSIAVTNNATANVSQGAVTITNSLTPTFSSATLTGTLTGRDWQSGIATTNTGSPGANQWQRLCTATISSQFADAQAEITMLQFGDGSATESYAKLVFRVKQQAAFGSNPIVETVLFDARGNITLAQFVAVIVQNTPTTIVDLYFQTTQTFQGFSVFPRYRNAGGGVFTWYPSGDTLIVSAPAGIGQVAATWAPFNATTINTTSTISENSQRVFSPNNLNLDNTNPAQISGTPGPGVSTVYARRDHIHEGVTSVAGRDGAVTLTAADIGAGTFPTGTFNFPGTLQAGGSQVYTAANPPPGTTWANLSGKPFWLNTTNLVYSITATENPGVTTPLPSGFYDINNGASATHVPTSQTFHHIIQNRHTQTSNNYTMQLAMSFFAADRNLYIRQIDNASASPWYKVYSTFSGIAGTDITANTITANQVNATIITSGVIQASQNITVGTAGGNRVEITSAVGIRGVNGGVTKFQVDNAGNATFSGNVSAATITGGTISATKFNGVAILANALKLGFRIA